ncbi:MAG: hypothetical protein HND58_17245 [Planctomycetota bacterium]|nr:MAG: hypothetical protein HND58_17245 [Planctomycetota bacterium]
MPCPRRQPSPPPWRGRSRREPPTGRARRQAFDQAIALTQRYASLAVTTLAKVMADASAANAAKVSAATAMLKFGRESIELDDLAARIETLESEREDEGNQR